jgi:hypothetical protein
MLWFNSNLRTQILSIRVAQYTTNLIYKVDEGINSHTNLQFMKQNSNLPQGL